MAFLVAGAWRRVPLYETFIEGAKDGFDVAKSLLPYLVAMLCAVGVLRASGALDFVLDGIRWLVHAGGLDTRFVDALPTALVKPLSGSAARAMMIETMQHFGRGQLPGAAGGDHAGQHRDHLLRAGGVFRRGRHPPRAPRRGLRPDRRPGRRAGLDRRVLLVLRLDRHAATLPHGFAATMAASPLFPPDVHAMRIGLAANQLHHANRDAALFRWLRVCESAIRELELELHVVGRTCDAMLGEGMLQGYPAMKRYPYGRHGGLMKLVAEVVGLGEARTLDGGDLPDRSGRPVLGLP